MNQLGPILAATDFSTLARHAAERAAALAGETGASLTLTHVLPSAPLQALRQWMGAGQPAERQLRDDAQLRLRELGEELPAGGGPTRTMVLEGIVADEIGRVANEIDASFVVVGARGAGQVRRLVLGNTSERVMRRTSRPLLVVRRPPDGAYRRVLVTLDFSPWSAHALGLAKQVAGRAQLVLLNAFEVPFEGKLHYAGVDPATIERYREQARAQAVERIDSLAAGSRLEAGRWSACIVEGEPSRCIVQQEKERGCDLVVLGKHGQSAAEDLLLGSVTRHVLAEGGADVLIATAYAT